VRLRALVAQAVAAEEATASNQAPESAAPQNSPAPADPKVETDNLEATASSPVGIDGAFLVCLPIDQKINCRLDDKQKTKLSLNPKETTHFTVVDPKGKATPVTNHASNQPDYSWQLDYSLVLKGFYGIRLLVSNVDTGASRPYAASVLAMTYAGGGRYAMLGNCSRVLSKSFPSFDDMMQKMGGPSNDPIPFNISVGGEYFLSVGIACGMNSNNNLVRILDSQGKTVSMLPLRNENQGMRASLGNLAPGAYQFQAVPASIGSDLDNFILSDVNISSRQVADPGSAANGQPEKE